MSITKSIKGGHWGTSFVTITRLFREKAIQRSVLQRGLGFSGGLRMLLGIWSCLAYGVLTAPEADAAERPNFLFILTDDQSPFTLEAYGNTECNAPNIDRLAKEGMTFHDAHHMGSWSGAVCRPSRTMIMTGRSVWRIPGATGNKPANKADKASQAKLTAEAAASSMPALFNAAGYDTFRTCKRGNTFPPASELFDVLFEKDMREGNDERGSAWHANHALDFLAKRQAEKDTDPFLMFLGFSHPHDPRNGKPELLDKYGAVNLSKPPTELNPQAPALQINYLPAHPFPHGHPGLRDETKVAGVLTDRSEATIRNELGREYACIENIDIQVGRVLDKLSEMGELDNTYVFFTADHGIAVGRHGLTGKQNLYEHTWRVPFLVRGPGIQPGSQASGFIYLMDVVSTLCDLADIERPEAMEGMSFRPVLEGKQDRIRDVLYGVYCGGTKPGMRSVKTAEGWKLIKYDVLDGAVHETQLFNLNENPNEFLVEHQAAEVVQLTGSHPMPEQVNLADDPRYAEKRKELEALLLSEQKRLDDPYRLWDQPQE
jgi:choline-sulfatase